MNKAILYYLLITSSCLGISNQSLAQHSLTKTDTLSEITIVGRSARSILAQAVQNIAINYPSKPNTAHIQMTYAIHDTAGKAMIDFNGNLVTSFPAYSDTYHYFNVCLLKPSQSIDNSKTLPYFDNFKCISTTEILKTSLLLPQLPFLKNSEAYTFELLGLRKKAGLQYYEIAFKPQKQGKAFTYAGTLWIETKSHAFSELDFTLVAHTKNNRLNMFLINPGSKESGKYYTRFNSQHFMINFAKQGSLYELAQISYEDSFRLAKKSLGFNANFTSQALVQNTHSLVSAEALGQGMPFYLHELKTTQYTASPAPERPSKFYQKMLNKMAAKLEKEDLSS